MKLSVKFSARTAQNKISVLLQFHIHSMALAVGSIFLQYLQAVALKCDRWPDLRC